MLFWHDADLYGFPVRAWGFCVKKKPKRGLTLRPAEATKVAMFAKRCSLSILGGLACRRDPNLVSAINGWLVVTCIIPESCSSRNNTPSFYTATTPDSTVPGDLPRQHVGVLYQPSTLNGEGNPSQTVFCKATDNLLPQIWPHLHQMWIHASKEQGHRCWTLSCHPGINSELCCLLKPPSLSVDKATFFF